MVPLHRVQLQGAYDLRIRSEICIYDTFMSGVCRSGVDPTDVRNVYLNVEIQLAGQCLLNPGQCIVYLFVRLLWYLKLDRHNWFVVGF